MTGSVVGAAWLIVRPTSFDGAAGLVFAGFVAVTVAQLVWAWSRHGPPGRHWTSRRSPRCWSRPPLGGARRCDQVVAGSEPARGHPSPTGFGAGALALTGVVALAVGIAARRARSGPLRVLAERSYLWARHLGDPGRLAPVMSGRRGPAMSTSPGTVRARSIAATDTLPPTFPIGTFVAANPLRGLEHLPFERAAHVRGAEHRCTFVPPAESTGAPRPGPHHRRSPPRRAARAGGPRPICRCPHGTPIGWTSPWRTVVPPTRPRTRRCRGQCTPVPSSGPGRCPAGSAVPSGRLADRLDAYLGQWCAAYLDQGQADWQMPGRELGLYPALAGAGAT